MKITNYFFAMMALVLAGCHSAQLHKSKKLQPTEKLAYNDSLLLSRRNAGIDFIAKGEKPVPWSLEMDYDHTFLFKSSDGINVSTAPAAGISNKEKNVETFLVTGFDPRGPKGSMEIAIYNEGCSHTSQKNKVTVFTNNILYEGCGEFLYNEQLNNRWVLQEIDDRYPDLGDFPNGLPEMTLDLTKRRMYGLDGCNSLSAEINIRGDRIQFGTIQSTLKACVGVKTELVKWKLIDNHLVEYRFRNKELVLYLIDDSRLIFKPTY